MKYFILCQKVGTYQLAVMAKAMNKPVYAVAESFKFERIYPLNQKEVPNKHKVSLPRSCHLYKRCVNARQGVKPFLVSLSSASSLSFECALRRSGYRIGYEPTKMS